MQGMQQFFLLFLLLEIPHQVLSFGIQDASFVKQHLLSLTQQSVSCVQKAALGFSLMTCLVWSAPPPPSAHAYPNKVSSAYDDRPKRHGPQPTDLGVAVRKDLIGEEYWGLKHCGVAPNCFCSTDSPEDDPDHSIPAWTWPQQYTSKEKAFQDLYDAISAEYAPGQANIDGGGFEIQTFNPNKGYFYTVFESLKYGYRDDVEFAWIQEDSNMPNNRVQVRSSSRVGYLDYGVNAKRLNYIAQLLQKRGWNAPGVDFQTHSRYVLENGYTFQTMNRHCNDFWKYLTRWYQIGSGNTVQYRFLTDATRQKIKRPIANEHLISMILAKTPSSHVDTAQVRLVIDSSIFNSSSGQTTVEITTLSSAIAIASQHHVDLVGINLDQDPVVIKAVDLQKLLYKEAKKTNNNLASSTHKIVKEFQFRTGIDDHDMQRKVDNLISYLRKGHPCQINIQYYQKFRKHGNSPMSEEENLSILNQQTLVMEKTLQRIKDGVGTAGTQQGQVKMNEEKTRCSINFHPNTKQR